MSRLGIPGLVFAVLTIGYYSVLAIPPGDDVQRKRAIKGIEDVGGIIEYDETSNWLI